MLKQQVFLESANIEKYVGIMNEIKRRMEVVDAFRSGQRNAVFEPTTIETIGLQLRKTFELIAFASLAANRSKYCAAYADFAKHWRAAELLKNLQRINADFYPQPVIATESDEPGVLHDWKDRDRDYLTQQGLSEGHGRCGRLLHATNPFGKPINYRFYQEHFAIWRSEIGNLLNMHRIRLVGDTGLYLIQMAAGEQNEVRWTRWERIPRPLVGSACPCG